MNRGIKGQTERGTSSTTPPVGLFRAYNGAQALFVAGRPVPPLCIDLLPQDAGELPAAERFKDTVKDAVQAGLRLFRLRSVVPAWAGSGTEAYAELTRRLQALGTDGYFIVEVVVDAPSEWLASHADETARFCLRPASAETVEPDAAAKTPGRAGRAERNPDTSAICASWASRRWLTDAGEAVTRLVRHLMQSEWGARCLGFQVACGPNGDWTHPDANRLPDIGPRMTERFRALSVDKYRRNQGLLRQGWDDPRADFDRIRCPDAFERRYADIGILRNPARSRKMLDYYECFYGAQNEAALYFCDLIKRITEKRALVGIAYASPFGNASLAEAAHGLPEPIFDSPNVDFLVGSATAPGDTGISTFNGSLQLREKFLFVSARPGAALPLEIARAQTHVAGLMAPLSAWASGGADAFKIAGRNLQSPAVVQQRPAHIAVIVDALQPTYMAGSDEMRATWVQESFNAQVEELARTGALYDTYLLSDLFHPRFRDHKVYVFLNTLYLSEAERRRIDARVKRSEQFTVWFWGAGILTEKGTDETAAQHLQDMKVRLEKGETTLRVRVVEANDALTWGMHVGSTFGPARTAVPTLTIGDRTAKRLGANSDNKTVFAVRRNADWTGVQYGTLPVPAALLRNVLRAASVHLYADITSSAASGTGTEERVIAGASLIAVKRSTTGTVTVSLPAPHDVIDPLSGKKLQTGSDIMLDVRAGEPRIVEIRPLPKRS